MPCANDWKSGIDCSGCARHGKRGYVLCGVCGIEVPQISKATDPQFSRCRQHGTWGGNHEEREAKKQSALQKLHESKSVKPTVEQPLIVYGKRTGGASIRKLAETFDMQIAREAAKQHGRAFIQRRGAGAVFGSYDERRRRLEKL